MGTGGVVIGIVVAVVIIGAIWLPTRAVRRRGLAAPTINTAPSRRPKEMRGAKDLRGGTGPPRTRPIGAGRDATHRGRARGCGPVYTEPVSTHPTPAPDPDEPSPAAFEEIISSHRLEGFSDGVMAVIITVMAFNLRPPAHENWASLDQRIPSLLIYVLSFTVIGIYWNNHHHLLRLTTISAGVMWANLSLLLSLSLVPVVTEWVGQAGRSRWPAVAYGIVSLTSALTYFILVRTIVAANHHDGQLVRALRRDRKGPASPLVSMAGIALAVVTPLLSYACFALLSLMWIIPDRRLVRPHRR